MHIKKILLTTACVLVLAGCGLTPEEMAQIQAQRSEQGNSQVAEMGHDGKTPRTIPMERILPVLPRGYSARLPHRLLKPQGVVEVASAPVEEAKPVPAAPAPVAVADIQEVPLSITPPAMSMPVTQEVPTLSAEPVIEKPATTPALAVSAMSSASPVQAKLDSAPDFVPERPISLTSAGYTPAPKPEPTMPPVEPQGLPAQAVEAEMPVSSPALPVVAEVKKASVVWRELSDYNPDNFGSETEDVSPEPQAPVVPQGRKYNKNVTVYLPDDDSVGSDYPAPIIVSSAGKSGIDNSDLTPVTLVPPPVMSEPERMQQLFFSHASAAIDLQDKKHLQRVAQGLKNNPQQITVVGHASTRVDNVTDPVEKKMINFRMAQRRADAVTGEMKKSGVQPDWVEAVSKGDEEPNPNPGHLTQEAADRRVDVFVSQADRK